MPRTTIHIFCASRRAKILSECQLKRGRDVHTDPFSLEVVCDYCPKQFNTESDRSRHIVLNADCRQAHREAVAARKAQLAQSRLNEALESSTQPVDDEQSSVAPEPEEVWDPMEGCSTKPMRPKPPVAVHTPMLSALADGTCAERFPIEEAGCPISDDQVQDPDLELYLRLFGKLADPDQFEIAELLMTTGLSNASRNRLLKSSLYKGKATWRNSKQLVKDIDRLPHGPGWKMETLVTRYGGIERRNYLFMRDILEVIRDLIGKRRFRRFMRYAPIRHWVSESKKSRIYGEMWTGDWWWRMQMILAVLDKFATIAPLIIASDKTSISVLSGGQEVYPVYLTIGNISKSVRRKAKKGATVLLGYLPVDKFEDVKSRDERARLRANLTHRAMERIMEPLKTASKDGVEMWCADGRLRRVYPIFAAFVGDWPEQCMMSCAAQSGCPICMTPFNGRGDGKKSAPPRRPSETLSAINTYFNHARYRGRLDELKLKPWWPWWAGLPYVNFHASIVPDLLHQLHQGLFKSHILSWAYRLMQDGPADRRFMAMSPAEGMRHFNRRVSKIQRWTGRESKELMKQFLPAIAGSDCDADFVELVCAALDFMYYAHSSQLNDEDLGEMEHALGTFHRLKRVLVKAGVFEGIWRFDDIPKIHMLSHYVHQTREFGTPDGYNTESPEHLHILCAKIPYRASNKVRPTVQMIKYIQRREALRIHKAYLIDIYGSTMDDDEDEDMTEAGDIFEGLEMSEGNMNNEEEVLEVECKVNQGDDHEPRVENGAYNEEGPQADEGEFDITKTAHYPAPEVAIAKQATRARVPVQEVMELHGTPNLPEALSKCLTARYHVPLERSTIYPSYDTIPIWHRFKLHHLPLPFAPEEPRKDDAIRARPARNALSAAFDTVLFKHAPNKFGLQRYRSGHVRAIFGLPDHLRSTSLPTHFVYVDLFTPFPPSVSPFHRMPTTGHQLRSNGKRHSIVIPITDVVMACHLAPQFKHLEPTTQSLACINMLSHCPRFFFNPYYNHYVYKLVEHWRRIKAQT
ncbi:hypothetical protein RhiJN_24425 [Ceratobasidium sp. AG-Ba]|nr:hypothetical protein RhiJN_24425 [Ceratobasidium sp. AG-Ba]